MTTKSRSDIVERMARAEAKLQGLKWSQLKSAKQVLRDDCKRYLTLLRRTGLSVVLKAPRSLRTSG